MADPASEPPGRSGPVDTANALLRIGTLHDDESMLLRARRVAEHPPAVKAPDAAD